jgi:hypothetical protein
MERSRRVVPAGLLGMLGLLAAIEASVCRHGLAFAEMAHDWAERGRDAARHVRACDVLCLGDSTVKLGVAPRVIEARTGRRCRSLAVTAGPPSVSYYLLRRALDSGARPSAVVFTALPSLLRRAEQWDGENWRQFLSIPEGLDAARAAGQVAPLTQAVLGRSLPSFAIRFDIRAGLRAALKGEGAALRVECRAHRRNWAVNGGANFLEDHATTTDPAVWLVEHVSASWECDPLKASYVDRFLALAEAHGIRVYWLLPPFDPVAQAATERSGQEARVERFVRAASARHRNVVVVDGRRAGYSHAAFLDPIHLRIGGAAALSEAMAAVLRRDLATPGAAGRWVDLPPYRDAPGDVPLESLERSRMAAVQEELNSSAVARGNNSRILK